MSFGEDIYGRFWWWDVFLHGLSGFTLGLIGFLILYMLYQDKKFIARLILIVIFEFSFALAIGGLWEIFEFSMDQFFRQNMQKSGLIDTMWELIVDTLSVALAGSLALFYLIRRKVVRKVKFLKKN